ncbi:MAG: tRNA preQ1(34) S-adenosylmethionine ribosyltransferase-isomerase QueA [Legionellales bacterium]|nr:tRNA preQ1(34) S-adenosylmethionine ribosyltransferase-isomerase QueA [Legionellales bacterium]
MPDFTQRVDDFDFELPDALIARYPLPTRSASRLLHLDTSSGTLFDRAFSDLVELLHPNDLLIANNSRVIPARLFGQKRTGGRVEILIERITGPHTALAHMRASKAAKSGALVELDEGYRLMVGERHGQLFEICFAGVEHVIQILEKIGHMPLPPYMARRDEIADKERYQTVYAEHNGSVAAPTAGLHFDERLLEKLHEKGVGIEYITLHVGAGTFQPLRVEYLHEHKMHHEYLEISQETVARIKQTKERGGRIIAVGTTSVRSLETAASSGELKPFQGESALFIYPGFEFKVVDAIITNFHLPKSSLIMLVSAFASLPQVMKAYQHAIAQQYRFYSYGDAMFIERNHKSGI